MTKFKVTNVIGAAILASGTTALAGDVHLTIESWCNDDLVIWQDKIIPVFEADNPGVPVKFTPSAPTECNAVLNSKLYAGLAGDIITCRPFDVSLALYTAGHLADITNIEGMKTLPQLQNQAGVRMTPVFSIVCRWPLLSTGLFTIRRRLPSST